MSASENRSRATQPFTNSSCVLTCRTSRPGPTSAVFLQCWEPVKQINAGGFTCHFQKIATHGGEEPKIRFQRGLGSPFFSSGALVLLFNVELSPPPNRGGAQKRTRAQRYTSQATYSRCNRIVCCRVRVQLWIMPSIDPLTREFYLRCK